MAEIRITQRDLRQLERSLQRMSSDVRGPVARDALSAGARLVEAEARSNAVPLSRTGASNIRSEFTEDSRPGTQEIYVGVGPSNTNQDDGFYLRFFEYGTRERVTKGGEARGRMPSRPWLRPALDTQAEAVRRAAARIIMQGLERHGRSV